MNKLAICAISKNELDMKEWIAYHLVVGIDRFYIYDNNDIPTLKNELKEYIDLGMVEVIDFQGLSRQMPAYDHCLKNYGDQNEWLAMVDADEHLLPKQTDYIPDILDRFKQYGGLQVNWIIFGSNGHIQRPNGLVIENYTAASTPSWKENLHTKAIVQPKYVVSSGGNPHCFRYQRGFYAVSEKEVMVPNAWSKEWSGELLQLNHYTTKSYEDFSMKISKGRADAAHLPTRKIDDLKMIDNFCVEENREICRFADKVKEMMK